MSQGSTLECAMEILRQTGGSNLDLLSSRQSTQSSFALAVSYIEFYHKIHLKKIFFNLIIF